MRREGYLMDRIASRDNLREALRLALRGRRRRLEATRTIRDVETWLESLQRDLVTGNWRVGRYQRFVICDPKRRVIHAAPFRQRVLHHAIMDVAGPVLERRAIFDSYACRKGKGAHRARERAQQFCRHFDYYLKLDIRKYFDSVRHDLLVGQFERIFKDESLLRLLYDIIGSYETEPGQGLPIGSLISQHAANAFLEPLDRHIKEQLKIRGYVRYMDDLVLWHDSRAELEQCRGSVEHFLRERLRLELKLAQFGFCRDGLHFLGVRVTREAIYPDGRARRRLSANLKSCEAAYSLGTMDHLDLQRRATALLAALGNTSCSDWRRRNLFSGAETL
jgi:retron-type reverse transcriptase